MTSRSSAQREQLVTSIRTLAEEGHSSQQIAEKLMLDQGAVRGLAKRATPPVQFRTRPGKPPAPLHTDPSKSENFQRKHTAYAKPFLT